MASRNLNKKIKLYYDLGLSPTEILCFLALADNIVISKRTLKRILRGLNLRRRIEQADILDVSLFIVKQLQNCGRLHGYRWMHHKCKQAGLNIPQDTVLSLLNILDPNGVAARKRSRLKRRQYVSKGPNYVWHVDSHDKLKPYGIAINGCIDGYSRNMMWLEANTTSSDPKVIAGYYIKVVKEKGGCPQRIRADMGTENSHIDQMQRFLRRNHDDEFSGDKSFLYGKSTHNQRIEWFWGIFRKQVGQFWMDLFHDLTDDEVALFVGDFLDKSLVQFCFLQLIQNDIDELVTSWNTHHISSCCNAFSQGNRPIMMYCLPELYNMENRLCVVDPEDVSFCEEEIQPKEHIPCDSTIRELCCLIMQESDLDMPSDAAEGLELYKILRREIRILL